MRDRPEPKKRPRKDEQPEARPFDIESYRLSPDSDRVFREGDPLYALYDVYGYRPVDLARPDNAKLALCRDKKRVQSIPVTAYRVAVDRDAGSVRYLTMLDTGKLVPTGNENESGLVQRRFTVTPAKR